MGQGHSKSPHLEIDESPHLFSFPVLLKGSAAEGIKTHVLMCHPEEKIQSRLLAFLKISD